MNEFVGNSRLPKPVCSRRTNDAKRLQQAKRVCHHARLTDLLVRGLTKWSTPDDMSLATIARCYEIEHGGWSDRITLGSRLVGKEGPTGQGRVGRRLVGHTNDTREFNTRFFGFLAV